MDEECRRMCLSHKHMHTLLFQLAPDNTHARPACGVHVAARVIDAMLDPRGDATCFYDTYPTIAPDYVAAHVGSMETLVYNASHSWATCGVRIGGMLKRDHVLHDHIGVGFAMLDANKLVHKVAAVHAILLAHKHADFAPALALARGFVSRLESIVEQRDVVLHALHAVCESNSKASLEFLKAMLGSVNASWCDSLSHAGRTTIDVLAKCTACGTKTEDSALRRLSDVYSAPLPAQDQARMHVSLVRRGPDGSNALARFFAAFGKSPASWDPTCSHAAVFRRMMSHVDVLQWGAAQGQCANYHTMMCTMLNNAFLAAEVAIDTGDMACHSKLDRDVARTLGSHNAFGVHTTDMDHTLSLATAAWMHGLWDTGCRIFDGTFARVPGGATAPVRMRVALEFVRCIDTSRATAWFTDNVAHKLDVWLSAHVGALPDETGQTRVCSVSEQAIAAAAAANMWQTAAAVVRHTATRALRDSIAAAYGRGNAGDCFVTACNVLGAVAPSMMQQLALGTPFVMQRHLQSSPWAFTAHARSVMRVFLVCCARHALCHDVMWHIASFMTHANTIGLRQV